MQTFMKLHRISAAGPRVAATLGAVVLAAISAASCSETTAFVVDVDVAGSVLLDGTPLPNARVVLRDQRTEVEVGFVLGIATADAAGRYTLRAAADRPGYGASCGYLVLYVDGYRNATELSDELRCSEPPQTIDLLISDASGSVIAR
jgi:hypothetical protein